MIGLKPIKIPSAKERVASELRKAILSKQLKEGENLTLESVAQQLNVSITPVREAFQILAHIQYSWHGKASYRESFDN